jgi:metal-responsive CopG/Arc/MetJ family transcriptional regulator
MNDLKNRERITFSIKKELVDKIKELSESTRIPQSRLIDEAIELLLRKHQGEK